MLKQFIKENWLKYLIGAFFVAVVDLLQLITPWIIGDVVDRLKVGISDPSVLKLSIFSIMAIAGGMFFSRFLWRILIMGAARKFEYYSKKVLFEKLLKMPPNFFDKMRIGDFMARFTNDVRAVRMSMGPAIVMTVDAVFLTIVTVFAMGSVVSWRLTWVSAFPLPFLALVSAFFGRMIHSRFKKVQASFSNLTDTVEESISGVRVVKSYGIEDLRNGMLEDKSNDYVNKNMSLVKIWGMFFPLVQLLASFGFVLALFFGGRQVILEQITLGKFVTFTSYLGMLVWPMMAIGWLINIIQRGRASYGRLMDIMNRKSNIVTENPVELDEIKGDIRFNNLTFKYDTSKEPVLKNINIDIKPGSKTAIIGTTGSGKSTLAKLIARMYPVPDNKIFIDGVDINKIDPNLIRKYVSYVPQETFLFTETVKNNIAFGVENYTDEEIINFAQLAAVHDDIKNFNRGYATRVGERGVTLSGGQKQRIAIARALIRKAPIVVLDDCLSAVDTETETAILQSLQKEQETRTIIVISHRLKAVRDSDMIYVLHNGEIIENGQHDELIANNGLYKKMYERQLLEEKIEEE
ncbi:MAG: ABC transporter ATP-binding protein [Kosmotogaceae bacterium]